MAFHHTSLIFSLSKVKIYLRYTKTSSLKAKGLCGIEQYIETLMHNVTASNAYLGNQKNAREFDFAYYRSKDRLAPRLYEDIFKEVEQIGI